MGSQLNTRRPRKGGPEREVGIHINLGTDYNESAGDLIITVSEARRKVEEVLNRRKTRIPNPEYAMSNYWGYINISNIIYYCYYYLFLLIEIELH